MVIEQDILGVRHIKNFYLSIKYEFENNSDTIVDFKNVKRIDLSVAQVLISLNRSARRDGKTIRLKSVSDEVRTQMKISGLKI